MAEDPELWQKRVDKTEDRNREQVERPLRDENIRRINFKPEPSAPNYSRAAKVEVPRALFESSEQQLDSLGPEPPYPSHNEQAH